MAQQNVQGLLGSGSAIHDLAGNPLFNIGAALMANRYDARINPFTAGIGALQQAGEQQRIQSAQQRDAQMREELKKYFDLLAEQYRNLGLPPPAVPNYEGVGETATLPGQSEPMRNYYQMGWERALRPR